MSTQQQRPENPARRDKHDDMQRKHRGGDEMKQGHPNGGDEGEERRRVRQREEDDNIGDDGIRNKSRDR
jgi:hypothetical protein